MTGNKEKTKGVSLLTPKGDTTQKRRQAFRREKLNSAARAAGWASWSAYETAVINGRAEVIR